LTFELSRFFDCPNISLHFDNILWQLNAQALALWYNNQNRGIIFGGLFMGRAELLSVLFVLSCLLCGCNSGAKQDKSEITPYRLTESISFRKEVLNLGGVELSSPRQMASDGDMLFICDSGNSRIIKYDVRNNSAEILGKHDSIPVEFVEPACIAASDTQICVYDRGSDKIRVLTSEGELIWEFNLDDEFDFLSEIKSVEICDDGSVYFSLIAFDKHTSSSGIYLLKEGDLLKISEYTVGELCCNEDSVYYISIYELKDDNSWITGYAELLKIKGEKCERVSAFSDGFSAVGLECFDGKLYAYDFVTQSVNAFYPDEEYIETVFSEPVVNDFSYNGFCGDNDGNFYLCDTKGNTVYKLVKDD